LGLGHGFVSSGLFICVGGILYDRSHTRLISIYKGLAQIMPVFSILFFILCLGNAGTPLTVNFIGEFMSLYGIFERLPILGLLSSTSIILSASYTIYMFNRTTFGGNFSKFFIINIIDLSKREFIILLILVIFTLLFGVYPSCILDGINFNLSSLLYVT
jgi:NADH-ubiquinone oxidoreductase chain 4